MASSVATPLERSLGSIAGVTEMTSSSSQGSTRVTLQFDLSRDINGAARDVQAAINAARSLLPTSLRSNPTYHKSNPSDAPIMTLALTSDTLSQGQLYDLASTIVAQKLSQVDGVGEVTVGGSSLPAVRVTVLPGALANRGVSLDDVRTALANANANRPKGVLENDRYHWQVMVNDQLSRAEQYKPLIVAWRDGAPVRVSDVAKVEDSVEDLYQTGFFNDRKAILMILRRQADANIIETVDAVRAQLPMLSALMPADVKMSVAQDRTPSIRASLHEAELTLVIAVGLVVLVVLLFLPLARRADPQRRGAGVADRHLLRHVPVRLHAEHDLADGADRGHRLRGGRRHRGAGEHHAPRRARHDADARACAARARSASPCCP